MLFQVIDVEHTGEDEQADQALIEVGWVTLVADEARIDVLDVDPHAGALLLNPGRPIPPESMGVHHIMDDDVLDAPAWRDVADQVFANPVDYYVAFSGDEAETFAQWTGGKPWIDVRKAALRMWDDAPKHNLQTLRYWRNPYGMVRARARPAHRAYPDAYVTAYLLKALFQDGANLDDMLEWSAEPALEARCWVGSGRGLKWKDVDTGLLHWILGKGPIVPGREGGFREDILFTCRYWLEQHDREWERQRQDQSAEAPQQHPDEDNPPAPFNDDAPF